MLCSEIGETLRLRDGDIRSIPISLSVRGISDGEGEDTSLEQALALSSARVGWATWCVRMDSKDRATWVTGLVSSTASAPETFATVACWPLLIDIGRDAPTAVVLSPPTAETSVSLVSLGWSEASPTVDGGSSARCACGSAWCSGRAEVEGLVFWFLNRKSLRAQLETLCLGLSALGAALGCV